MTSPRTHAASLAALAFAATSVPALAHVTLEYQVAPANARYKASFRVGHGCNGSPTRQLSVALPAGVRNAKPMPKPGWSLEVHPTRVTWTANGREHMLADAHYDEFVLLAQMPQQAGTLYWPVVQLCEQGSHEWTQVPAPGQKHSELKSPAASLEVLPAGDAAGHAH
jgi:uncharacterized protein YcnI